MKLTKFRIIGQLGYDNCGSGCLKMIARHYGKFYSLLYLRDKCGLTNYGPKLDFRAEAKGTAEQRRFQNCLSNHSIL